jgi:hypothetical protein
MADGEIIVGVKRVIVNEDYGLINGNDHDLALLELGSILQNSILAENFFG